MNLNVTTLRSWSAVITDTLYGLLAGAIFLILIPKLVERDALSQPEAIVLAILFAILAGSHVGTAVLNVVALTKKNRVAH